VIHIRIQSLIKGNLLILSLINDWNFENGTSHQLCTEPIEMRTHKYVPYRTIANRTRVPCACAYLVPVPILVPVLVLLSCGGAGLRHAGAPLCRPRTIAFWREYSLFCCPRCSRAV